MTRGGWLGALAAFTAFTLPSALVLVLFAMTVADISGPIGTGALHGLKIVAVAIVAQAVWGMARSLCPDKARATIAVAAVVVLATTSGAFGMIGAILVGAVAGLVVGRGTETQGVHLAVPVSRGIGFVALGIFAVLLVALPAFVTQGQGVAVFDSFFRAGALVFGGGHVVLPLLEAEVVQPGWVSATDFLAGYGGRAGSARSPFHIFGLSGQRPWARNQMD